MSGNTIYGSGKSTLRYIGSHISYLISFILIFCFDIPNTLAQVIYPYRTCTSPKELVEFSGIAKLDKNLLVGINDGGNSPTIYFIDTSGTLLRKRTFKTIKNIDWEDICYSNGVLTICDVGDNLNTRKETVLYFYDVKQDTITGSKRIHFNEKKIPLPKSKKDYDCEAAMALGDKIWLFTKTHSSPYTGKSYQYNIEKNDKKTNYTAVDSTNFGTRGFIYNSVTGAALSPKNIVAFLSCTHVWFKFSLLDEKSFFRNVTLDFDFDGITQKEAITFLSDYKFVVADERTAGMMGGRMYFFDLKPYITGQKKYTKPTVNLASVKKGKEKNMFELEISFVKGAKKTTVLFFDKEANCVFSQETGAMNANKKQRLLLDVKQAKQASKAYSFWIIEGNQVVFIDKIRPK
ncbi:MAG TPA: hypothetical protein VK177_03760 [Flavobacteriales bacterium]|nr:hypothetical protein [Flavobacteriales bacterium]